MGVDEVGRLLEQAETEAQDPARGQLQRLRMLALLELLYATGMRVSELVSLPARVLDQDGRFLMIRGKGNKERLVPLSQSAIAALKLYGGMLAVENAAAKDPAGEPLAVSGCVEGRLPAATGFCPRSEKSCDPRGPHPIY